MPAGSAPSPCRSFRRARAVTTSPASIEDDRKLKRRRRWIVRVISSGSAAAAKGCDARGAPTPFRRPPSLSKKRGPSSTRPSPAFRPRRCAREPRRGAHTAASPRSCSEATRPSSSTTSFPCPRAYRRSSRQRRARSVRRERSRDRRRGSLQIHGHGRRKRRGRV